MYKERKALVPNLITVKFDLVPLQPLRYEKNRFKIKAPYVKSHNKDFFH